MDVTSSGGSRTVAFVSRYGVLCALLVLIVVARVLYDGFFEGGNLKNILSQNAPVGIVAIGMTLVIIAGGFDLSVGATYAAGATFYASLAGHVPLELAALLTLLVGGGAGLINGSVITRLRVNPFVATLGTASVFGGAAFLYSNSSPYIVNMSGFTNLGQGSIAGVPYAVWLLGAVAAIGWVVLRYSVYGRRLYAVGGNDEAARLAGMRVDALRASTYVIVAMCAALGGIITASRLGVGQADIAGTIALDAIAVVVIGGTSLFGGEGAMWRTLVGLLIIAIINNLGDSLAWDSNVQSVIKGMIIIIAVALDALGRRRRA